MFLLAAAPDPWPGAELDDHLASCQACSELTLATRPRPLHWIVGVPTDALADRDFLALAVVDPVVFDVEAELARGGMGRIARARDRRLGRDVAIKEMLSPELGPRFEREVAITAQLQHPAIVPVYEAGRWPDGSAFYAMRLVSGGTLAHAIGKTRTLEDRLALLPHMIAVTDALAYAHSKRIVHRDLKPSNVLVGEFGETLVIDWGLAKQLDHEIEGAMGSGDRPIDRDLTALGSVIGTPGFMSPEQVAGVIVDERTDVYALGAMLYNLLAGSPPYWSGDATITASLIQERERAGPPPPIATLAPHVPIDLRVVIERAMARDRGARYASAKEMADELRRFTAGQLLRSRQYTRRELIARWLRRHRTAVIVAAIAAIALAMLGAASVAQTVRRREQAELALARSRIEQGRQLLIAGSPGHAAALFAAALDHVPDDALAHRLATIAVRDANRRLAGFTGTSAAFRSDGRALAIGRADGSIAIVDPRTGAVTQTLTGRAAPSRLAYAASGQLLVTSHDGVDLVDPATHKTTALHRGEVRAARFAGDRIAIADAASVRLVGPGAAVQQAAAADVRALDVAGDRLLAVARDATFVFALPELQRLATLPAATYAMLDRDGSIVLADGAALRRYQLDGTFAMIRAGESQPLTRLGDGSLATGMELIGASATRGFAPGIAAELIAPLDATHVITGGFDRVLRIARLDVGRPLAVLDAAGATEQLIASPSGTRTVSLARDGAIELWDTGRLREPRTIAELAAPIQRIVVGRSGIAAWLHSMAGNTVAVLDSTNARVGLVPGWPVGYRPGGDELVVNDGGRLFVYAARDASQLRVLDDPSAIQTAAFSSSGALLATASAGQVTLRDARTWQVIRSLAIPRSDATAIAIDDAGHVIIGHGDGAMERYDATTGPTGARLAGHGAHVEDMALRGDRLVTISWDRTTRAWDIGSGASRGVLLPSSGHSLALSPSGRWLATVDGSPVVNLWDAERGALVEQVAAARPLDAAAFLGEDQLVVGGGDGRLEQIELGERDVDTRELARLAGAMGWQLVDGRVAWRRVD